MKRLIFSLFTAQLLFLGACKTDDKAEIAAIHKVLDAQVSAWNRGDLGGYMSGYWDNDSLVFTSAKSVAQGYKTALLRYQKRYPTKDEMGDLSFRGLKTQLLADDVAFTIGEWVLHTKKQDFGGRFTLIWRKINGRWFIIADHSS